MATASAHVAPAVDDNNHYVKLTPLGDRIRLAYTVFFGEVPGASARRTIDANADGTIDEAEAHAFGARLAADVAGKLELDVDGKVQPIRWATVDVGMGTPEVAAGAFSVDLVAYACFDAPRGRHRVHVYDRYTPPRPGEAEASVEDSPGIAIEHARVGTAEDSSNDFRFAGAGGPLAEDGLDVELVAGPTAAVVPDAACPARRETNRRPPYGVLGALAGAIALGGASWILLRRRRRTRDA